MRIIAGTLGGRTFASPHSQRTHPMSDKVRGSLFNTLGDIASLHVLDAFAGTGALGFEAISRGAASALLLENDRAAQRVIAENITALQLDDKVRLVRAGAGSWLQTNTTLFDIVLCDPPYDNLQPNLLAHLATRMQSDGILVLSWPGKQPLPQFTNLHQVAGNSYGDIQLAFYRPIT